MDHPLTVAAVSHLYNSSGMGAGSETYGYNQSAARLPGMCATFSPGQFFVEDFFSRYYSRQFGSHLGNVRSSDLCIRNIR